MWDLLRLALGVCAQITALDHGNILGSNIITAELVIVTLMNWDKIIQKSHGSGQVDPFSTRAGRTLLQPTVFPDVASGHGCRLCHGYAGLAAMAAMTEAVATGHICQNSLLDLNPHAIRTQRLKQLHLKHVF